MEEPDYTPHPRTPEVRTFEQLPRSNISLSAEKFVSFTRDELRYDAYDHEQERNMPRWDDEETFYEWLLKAEIPRELAEMLYAHAPEVSFLLWPGYILGVASIIESNSLESEVRQGGYFLLATGPSGHFTVVSLHESNAGEVGYLPMSQIWGKSPEEVQDLYISVAPSIGDFLEACEKERESIPFDYYEALEKKG